VRCANQHEAAAAPGFQPSRMNGPTASILGGWSPAAQRLDELPAQVNQRLGFRTAEAAPQAFLRRASELLDLQHPNHQAAGRAMYAQAMRAQQLAPLATGERRDCYRAGRRGAGRPGRRWVAARQGTRRDPHARALSRVPPPNKCGSRPARRREPPDSLDPGRSPRSALQPPIADSSQSWFGRNSGAPPPPEHDRAGACRSAESTATSKRLAHALSPKGVVPSGAARRLPCHERDRRRRPARCLWRRGSRSITGPRDAC